MTEELFVLNVKGTGIIKHMTYSMVLTWQDDEDNPKNDEFYSKFEAHDSEKGNESTIVLKDGITEWCYDNLENSIRGRPIGPNPLDGPQLLFGSEADRACFVLKWM